MKYPLVISTLLLLLILVCVNLSFTSILEDFNVSSISHNRVRGEGEVKVDEEKQHPVDKGKNDKRGDVYFMVQIDKAGSSTLRNTFEARNKWYGNPDMGNPAVNRNLVGRCINPDSNFYPRRGTNKETTKVTKPGYPFIESKWEKFPHFWKIGNNVTSGCMDAITETAWKLWPDKGSAVSYRPKPIMRSDLCTPQSTVNCRRLVQLREPVSHIESHFEYFCKECKDGGKFCGPKVDAKCGRKHRKNHETIQSWARKFGNLFTRTLLYRGTYQGPFKPNRLTRPDTLKHADEVIRSLRDGGDCVVALEDPNRLSKIEACLGDQPGFYTKKLGLKGNTTTNKLKSTKKRLNLNVKDELREILAADIYLYESFFPFLAANGTNRSE
mmetsp:Transcript_6497/g.7936  ORF Transcript_6497/g.7936 Transcript_6497/m.7936 type:complete len:383 (-) Transcript_6497:154-1302(-)